MKKIQKTMVTLALMFGILSSLSSFAFLPKKNTNIKNPPITVRGIKGQKDIDITY